MDQVPRVRVSNLCKNYGKGLAFPETKVLNGINLQIMPGEFLAIMGPSGCGKTTMMNILGLMDKPSSGQYFIDGQLVEYSDDDQISNLRNKNIGFVFQQYHLLPRLAVWQNVRLPLLYRGTPDDEIENRCRIMLEKVDMYQYKDSKPSQLSGGQQQRVAIARALIGNPQMILADEPTGSLDVKNRDEIMGIFHTFIKKEGHTCIIVTHDPIIANKCERILRMEDGMLLPQAGLNFPTT